MGVPKFPSPRRLLLTRQQHCGTLHLHKRTALHERCSLSNPGTGGHLTGLNIPTTTEPSRQSRSRRPRKWLPVGGPSSVAPWKQHYSQRMTQRENTMFHKQRHTTPMLQPPPPVVLKEAVAVPPARRETTGLHQTKTPHPSALAAAAAPI